MNKWAWLCPWLSIALGTAVLVFWGLTLWTALLIALLLACPATMLWAAIKTRRPHDTTGEDK